jgi:hypothetical protein
MAARTRIFRGPRLRLDCRPRRLLVFQPHQPRRGSAAKTTRNAGDEARGVPSCEQRRCLVSSSELRRLLGVRSTGARAATDSAGENDPRVLNGGGDGREGRGGRERAGNGMPTASRRTKRYRTKERRRAWVPGAGACARESRGRKGGVVARERCARGRLASLARSVCASARSISIVGVLLSSYDLTGRRGSLSSPRGAA